MRYIYTFLIMFGFWILLSGKFDLFHLTLGVISSGLVSLISADLFMYDPQSRNHLTTGVRFLLYLPWLLFQIVLSTLHVTFLALHPKMKEQIDPTIVTFKTNLKTDIAKVALANSITLTPGTITIRVEDQVFYVHAISRKAAAGLPGEMEERLAKVFESD
ncbi:MAG: Na+/H+ antiporter subunit E [Desulfobulbaceae bacterium]|jgi:multicomponent Na+:H+ antiporter subunit E|nr:Na+/H+ antiporter subunit E [Desulfobulbaceae bacterium]HKJ13244.1 Na+/H+ antiporter subunit E [Desulfobulbales bacterium]MDH3541111.1 Na+/H+ antiporter subunit E [Desulfobulbaceae bacterium]MDH3776126.1 Na+/H+ antiporter subunit E [Desulfobulbaceae bacterium]MDH3781992.1 Na+/H+ antiporter subunit E [Desulfobulbaceae bacterium]